jgi:two-component system nitrogen regulation sensor histidine kinase NtrY
MSFSEFHTALLLRIMALFASLTVMAWLLTHTDWYVTIALCAAVVAGQMTQFAHFATRSSRETARFLDAVRFDDGSQSFTGLSAEGPYRELGAAMTRILQRLQAMRSQREEEMHYVQSLLAHVPVALVSVDGAGGVLLLNRAAKLLFETPLIRTEQFTRHGVGFAAGLEALRPGNSAILQMERGTGPLHLKVVAIDLAVGSTQRRLVSLQNIENELSARELAAWQTVIRVLAHEMMNSLTPISSLAATARDRVREVLRTLPSSDAREPVLADAGEALEAVARRSEGLLHFVQSHRRLTRRLTAQIEITPVARIFGRLERLLAGELETRRIKLFLDIQPENLDIAVDAELLDQALINLARNAVDALVETSDGHIEFRAWRDSDGRTIITVTDNGAGIAPERRENIFVPFFTTKKNGSGIGLTLVRQITDAHGAIADVAEARGGGTTVRLRF